MVLEVNIVPRILKGSFFTLGLFFGCHYLFIIYIFHAVVGALNGLTHRFSSIFLWSTLMILNHQQHLSFTLALLWVNKMNQNHLLRARRAINYV